MNAKVKTLIETLIADSGAIVARKDLLVAATEQGIEHKLIYSDICKPDFRAPGRGQYDLQAALDNTPVVSSTPQPKPSAKPVVETVEMVSTYHNEVDHATYIPEVNKNYVRWGFHTDLKTILASKEFFPVFIAGESGNGKTMMVEQACAQSKREFIRVNISRETDEDDLIGGFRLKDGNTVFAKGPVIRAMEAGAVLLLDEIDRGDNKIMCLQSVLEGGSILLKKTGETIYPAPGFTVVATGNTTGRGSEDGRYSAATIIDDAFLERFPVMMNQPWPTKSVETKIVLNSMSRYDRVDEEFAEKLVTWAKIIRKTYDDDGIDDVISTRRLDHVCKAYGVFKSSNPGKDRLKAIRLATDRFSPETSEAIVDLYTKIDEGVLVDEDEVANTEGLEAQARTSVVN